MMKRKLTFLLFGLLLAVGWTNVASAQALPGNYADRLGIESVAPARMATPIAIAATDDPSIMAKAPTRATYNRPAVVKPKSYYDTLMYTWKGADDVIHTDSATKLATEPEQIYQLLKFVYMDKRFPGPYYNACDVNNQAEDPVYYGGIDGGWNIPSQSGSGSSTPVTYTYDAITITTSSNWAMFTAITIADASTDEVIESWTQNSSVTNQTLPTGWTSSSTVTYNTTYSACCMGGTSSSATITISSNHLNDIAANHASIRIYVNAFKRSANYTETLQFASGSVSASGELTTDTQRWYYDFSGTSSSGSASGATTPTDVIIRLAGGSMIRSITVSSGNTTITSWSNSTTLPTGWYSGGTLSRYTVNNGYYYALGGSGTLRIASSLFEGYNSITVTVVGICYSSSYAGELWIANSGNDGRSYFNTSQTTVTATINFPEVVPTDTYKPNEEGYTALVVSLKNTGKLYDLTNTFEDAFEFTDSTDVIGYIRDNIKSVQLLTDGLRIGEDEETGTVFNCSGTYNKFFFLGKGRARKKSSAVLASIGLTGDLKWPSYACEQGPFKYMFEQFSPTTGLKDSEINDFYLEMMDGNVYDVVHDCASVIQQAHQFSMSGNAGKQEYAMSGMNFFIPDYRLKYWTLNDTIGTYSDGTAWVETVDGRDMNPYMIADANGKTNVAYWNASPWAVNYAQYNTEHAPKVGIYILTLDADAQPCAGYDPETNTNYVVTLDWTSSLNEMSGREVPQTYIIYEVTYNDDGSEKLVPIDTVQNTTHYDFDGKQWPQGEHSQTHTYIIMGTPTDNEHPEFIAWSNEDDIVIPGLNDFLMLRGDHYESDFDVPKMQNWYRNFLTVSNDGYVGLTTDQIAQGDNLFNLLRFENKDTTVTKQVAQLKFENQSDGTVKYTVTYVDENNQNTQQIEPNTDTQHPEVSYERSAMGIQDVGYLTTKSDGDIIIQPNGYDVNFLEITVSTGSGYGSYNKTWTAPSALPSGWSVSDGSQWILEDGAYYLEGGGYILIPASVLGSYSTATVTIKAYGDAGKTAKIAVNGTSKTILNGEENARDYEWTVTMPGSSKLNAPNRATDLTFTPAGYSSSYIRSQTVGSATINMPNGDFGYDDYISMSGTITISTTEGKITKVIFNGQSTSYPVTYLSTTTGNYTTSNNVGTWTGEAESLTFTASSTVRCSSIVVTVSNDEPAEGTIYEKVTRTSDLTSGNYLIVYEDGNRAFDGSLSTLDAANNYFSVTIADNKIVTSKAAYFTYDADAKTLKSASGYYIGRTADSNGMNTNQSTTYVNNISIDNSGNAVIVGSGGAYMRYNNSSGQYRFRYFSSSTYSGQQAIALYKERVGDTPTPGTGNVVRMPNLRIVDQFAEKIPATNDHPNRYTYYLKLDGGDKESSMVPVPVQHTGAVLQGYYTLNEMLNDTDPDNFLPENMLSAEVDMNLSPTSAPYFYTINSVKNDVPASASDYDTYISVLQRRSAGDYQEMYKPDAASGFTGYTGQIHPSGEYDFFDFRAIQAEAMDDSLSYVPILWTNGIDRHWFVEDSLNNSYGAPLWINRIGNVNIVSSQIERQATVKQNGDIVWNPSVNWYDADSTQAYSLYLISDLQAEGILPNCNVEYEPYMFRLWLVDSTYSLRGYKWENLGQAGQHIVDDPESTPDGAWLLLDTKMCNNYQTVNGVSTYVPDLTYTISKVDGNQQGNSWADNIMFGAKISSTFKPRLVVRFYYKEKVKQQLTPVEPSELRGNRDGENDDHVGYVVLRGTNPNDPSTAVFEIVATGEVVSRTYYNTMGVMSEKPFEGVNIVVTRYSDGTTSTSKVLY